jgi:hypothetical protein
MSSYVTGTVIPVDGGSWASSGWLRNSSWQVDADRRHCAGLSACRLRSKKLEINMKINITLPFDHMSKIRTSS